MCASAKILSFTIPFPVYNINRDPDLNLSIGGSLEMLKMLSILSFITPLGDII